VFSRVSSSRSFVMYVASFLSQNVEETQYASTGDSQSGSEGESIAIYNMEDSAQLSCMP